MFKDINDAGERLSEALGEISGREITLFALSESAVFLCEILAKKLRVGYDMFFTSIITAPLNAECRLGVVDECKELLSNDPLLAAFGIDRDYMVGEARRHFEEEIAAARYKYRQGEFLGKVLGVEVAGGDFGEAWADVNGAAGGGGIAAGSMAGGVLDSKAGFAGADAGLGIAASSKSGSAADFKRGFGTSVDAKSGIVADAKNGFTINPALKGKSVVLVSAGVNAGLEMGIAAISFRKMGIEFLYAATPIISLAAKRELSPFFDGIFCVKCDPDFVLLEHYYECDLAALSEDEDEICAALARKNKYKKRS